MLHLLHCSRDTARQLLPPLFWPVFLHQIDSCISYFLGIRMLKSFSRLRSVQYQYVSATLCDCAIYFAWGTLRKMIVPVTATTTAAVTTYSSYCFSCSSYSSLFVSSTTFISLFLRSIQSSNRSNHRRFTTAAAALFHPRIPVIRRIPTAAYSSASFQPTTSRASDAPHLDPNC